MQVVVEGEPSEKASVDFGVPQGGQVAKGLVPALPPSEYLTKANPNRRIKTKLFKDCVTSNIIENQVINHDRGFLIKQCKTEQLNNSFFVKTCLD